MQISKAGKVHTENNDILHLIDIFLQVDSDSDFFKLRNKATSHRLAISGFRKSGCIPTGKMSLDEFKLP